MPEMIENSMLVDGYWDETEYGVPSRERLRRERQANEEAERERYYQEQYYREQKMQEELELEYMQGLEEPDGYGEG